MTHAQLLLRVLLARGCNPRAGSAILAARINLKQRRSLPQP